MGVKLKSWLAVLAIIAAPVAAQDADPRLAQARQMLADYDSDAATALLEEACAEDAAGACRGLLALYDQQYSDEAEINARQLAGRLCDTEDAIACIMLADYAQDGEGGEIDRVVRRTSLVSACDLGISAACVSAAYMASNGEGGPQDEEAARKLTAAACDQDNAEACLMAGDYDLRDAYNADDEATTAALEARARTYLAKSCELDFASGCGLLASLLAEGRGGPVDTDGAIALLDKACNADIYQCEMRLRIEMPR